MALRPNLWNPTDQAHPGKEEGGAMPNSGQSGRAHEVYPTSLHSLPPSWAPCPQHAEAVGWHQPRNPQAPLPAAPQRPSSHTEVHLAMSWTSAFAVYPPQRPAQMTTSQKVTRGSPSQSPAQMTTSQKVTRVSPSPAQMTTSQKVTRVSPSPAQMTTSQKVTRVSPSPAQMTTSQKVTRGSPWVSKDDRSNGNFIACFQTTLTKLQLIHAVGWVAVFVYALIYFARAFNGCKKMLYEVCKYKSHFSEDCKTLLPSKFGPRFCSLALHNKLLPSLTYRLR